MTERFSGGGYSDRQVSEMSSAPSPEQIITRASLASEHLDGILGRIPGVEGLWKELTQGHRSLSCKIVAGGVTYSIIAYTHEYDGHNERKMTVTSQTEGHRGTLQLSADFSEEGEILSGLFGMYGEKHKPGAKLQTHIRNARAWLKPLHEDPEPVVMVKQRHANIPLPPDEQIDGERHYGCGAISLTGRDGKTRYVPRPRRTHGQPNYHHIERLDRQGTIFKWPHLPGVMSNNPHSRELMNRKPEYVRVPLRRYQS